MYGFENIATHNGWTMAAAGALIVLCGLAVLSFVISQLHKFLDFLENRKRKYRQKDARYESNKIQSPPEFLIPQRFPEDIMVAANLYKPMVEQLGPSFPLSELYAISNKHGMPHPHLTIKGLREAGILVPVGGGEFSWKQETMVP
jgi:hypothetical protein